VSCEVTAGPRFDIVATLSGENNHPMATSAEPIEFRIERGEIIETGTGTADVSIFAGQVHRSQTANPCTLSVVAAPSFEVAAGRIFGSFNCAANLDVSGAPTTDCSAVFVFERCAA
jgi:hypothetical protein